MKKITRLLFALFVIAMLGTAASCSDPSSPSKAAKKYLKYLLDGKYDKFLDCMYVPSDIPADKAESRKALLHSILVEKGTKQLEEKGGLEDMEILWEDFYEEGRLAEVGLQYTYGNGEIQNDALRMRLGDDGKWYIDMQPK